MPSILPGYEYDIFISYRQNDNKPAAADRRDGWVTNFVAALKDELEATLKNPVSIYFDENPHDGLLETHQVGATLEKKLKCIVFIPIISQTYCDTTSFAWEHEFLPFLKMAREDELGMNITLANGNVASRVLPIKIHDLDATDQEVLERELEGPPRSIDFVYQEPGVNRPLKPSDDRNLNIEKTDYQNQINKVANALKEISLGVVNSQDDNDLDAKLKSWSNRRPSRAKSIRPTLKMVLGVLFIPALFVLAYFYYMDYTSHHPMRGPLEKSIAVLPFANTKPDPNTNYLGFAIANQIIGELDYNKSLTVRPSNAIRKYDQQVFDAGTVADDLNVNYILTGNYLMVGDVIRLDIELLDANNNKGIWREKLEVDFKNAFDLQDIVAQKVVDGLDVQFSAQELSIIKLDVASDPLSYEYYLRSLSYPISAEGSVLALEMLKKSVALDSTYAPAYAEFGFRTNVLLIYGSVEDRHPVNPEIYYLKALAINENQLVALANLGGRYAEIGRTSDAVETLRKAIKINPNNAFSRFFLGYVYRYGGMIDESIQEMEVALSLDPANSRFRSLGLSYYSIGNDKKALEAFALDEGTTWELGWRSILHHANGEFNEVKNLCQAINIIESSGAWSTICHVLVAAIEGNFEEGKHWANALENDNRDNQGMIIDAESSYFNAVFYSLNQDRAGAIRCMKNAVNNGYYNYPLMVRDSMLKFIREDEEFKVILSLARDKHLAFKERFF